jgi:hypothetical protein
MGVTYESCPACPDHPDGKCPMCGGEGYVEESLDPDLLSVWDADEDDDQR